MADNFKSGVSYFNIGYFTAKVAFPEDKIRCQYCPYCRCESDLKRYWCRLTDEMIYEPFINILPDFCPIVITGEITGTKKEEK